MKISIDLIRKLREETGAPVIRVKKVLEEFGDLPPGAGEKKAFEILQKEGFEKASKRESKETGQGIIATYLHHNKKVASLVELLCETDFVARNELFNELGQNLAMQVASMKPRDVKELESQEFIKDPAKKVADLVKEVIAKTGENVRIGRVFRIELGQ
ncbi:elongation factor Ts [Candidatus Woesebacteria bacterium]|nr:elongation factor Ts [Candidatus Woesebacteria bacterium]